jgi:hypothetical protein
MQGSATTCPTVAVDAIDMGRAADQRTVPAVLARAADLLGERRWVHRSTCRSSDPRLTALQAITLAVDELLGTAPRAVDAHTAALDAVCLHVFARRHGTKRGGGGRSVSVSSWEREPGQTTAAVVATLRHVAQSHREPGSVSTFAGFRPDGASGVPAHQGTGS